MPVKNTQNDFQKQAEEVVKKSHNKKVYFAIAIIFTAIAIGMFLGIIVIVNNYEYSQVYKNLLNNKKDAATEQENYYDVLEKKCGDDSCCLASLKYMKENNYKEADGNGNCPGGFKRNNMWCNTFSVSLKWCEPIKKNSTKDEIEKIALCEKIIYKNSKDRCYYDHAMSKNNTSLCGRIVDNVIKEDCYSNLSEKNKTDMPIFWALGSEPDSIPISNTTDVLFTTMQTGTEDKANKIIIEELNASGSVIRIIGNLNDNGINGDLAENDYVYSGTFKIGSLKEGNLFFRAKVDFLNISESIYTEKYKFGVTRFPIGLYSSDMSKVITNPKTGEKMISNEVIVGFIDSVSPDAIENIINAVDSEIIGIIFSLNIYQIKIFDTGDATGVNKIINKLLNYSEVEYAEPNYITEID